MLKFVLLISQWHHSEFVRLVVWVHCWELYSGIVGPFLRLFAELGWDITVTLHLLIKVGCL